MYSSPHRSHRSLPTHYVLAPLEMHHKYLRFGELAKYGEWGKFAAFVGHPKAENFSAPGWGGGSPQTAVVAGLRSALAMCVHPTFCWSGDAPDVLQPKITKTRPRTFGATELYRAPKLAVFVREGSVLYIVSLGIAFCRLNSAFSAYAVPS